MQRSIDLPNFDAVVHDANQSRTTVKIMVDKHAAAAVVQRMQPYKNVPRLFKPALEEVADYVRNTMIKDTFRSEGPGWKGLRPRTIRERIAEGYSGKHPILKRTGDLMEELTERSHPHHIEIIKVGKEARIEIGGSSKKFIENQRGVAKQRLPARPMIPGTGNVPIRDRDKRELTHILKRAVERAKRRTV